MSGGTAPAAIWRLSVTPDSWWLRAIAFAQWCRQWHRPCKLGEAYMRRTQLLCAIGVSLWSAMAAGRQATDAGALPGALRAHIQDERYGIVTSIRGLPLGVRDALQTLFGSGGLDIADPGAEFQVSGGVGNPKLPL